MTATPAQLARALTAHALGVRDTPDPAGIFDEFHQIEVGRRQLEVRILRDLMDGYEDENRELKTQRQCLILAALLGWGLFVIAAVCR